jgi:hypothetical protein
MPSFAARAMNVHVVVTRDKTGFADSGMTVFTPQEFCNISVEFPKRIVIVSPNLIFNLIF